jgi:hypothetical protein
VLTSPQVESLLSRLCLRLGFCLDPGAQERLIDDPPATVVDFVDAVFVAEGLDPATADRHLYRQVKAMIADAFRAAECE